MTTVAAATTLEALPIQDAPSPRHSPEVHADLVATILEFAHLFEPVRREDPEADHTN